MHWQSVLDYIFPPQCGGCNAIGTGLCTRCAPMSAVFERRLPTLNVRTLGLYEGDLRRAVLSLKSGRRDVARSAALRLAELAPPNAALIPIPTTPVRRWERGFDGCVLMARLAASAVDGTALNGLRHTRRDRQRGRSRTQRLSAHGRFIWRGEALHGMTVILLDDVVTTGATLEDCARAVRAAGAFVTQAIAIASAP